LQGDIERAIENLTQAIHLNPKQYRELAKTDADFDAIRPDDRFEALLST
jgi:superkiller protein 3